MKGFSWCPNLGWKPENSNIKVMNRKVLNTTVSGGWKCITEWQRAVTWHTLPSLCKHAVNQANITFGKGSGCPGVASVADTPLSVTHLALQKKPKSRTQFPPSKDSSDTALPAIILGGGGTQVTVKHDASPTVPPRSPEPRVSPSSSETLCPPLLFHGGAIRSASSWKPSITGRNTVGSISVFFPLP